MFNKTVHSTFQPPIKTGDIGIEIEMETNLNPVGIPLGVYSDNWKLVGDNSLKGYGGEFVFHKPQKPQKAKNLIFDLKKDLEKNGLEIKPSVRAGVHVHINVQKLTIKQLFRFACYYYLFEDLLTHYCGPNRVGNLFCLRARDAEYVISLVESCISELSLNKLSSDFIRYSALNFTSLFKFGSLEFRAMETRPDLSGIDDIIDALLIIRGKAMSDESLAGIAEDISFAGPGEWMEKVFGKDLYSKMKYKGCEEDMFYNFRLIQTLLYKVENIQ
jgi:hypothetical protein